MFINIKKGEKDNNFRFSEVYRILIVIGTRPEIIKMSPIIRECTNQGLEFSVLHTGQHYSYAMERPETIDVGSNVLAGTNLEKVLAAAVQIMDILRTWDNPFGNSVVIRSNILKKIKSKNVSYEKKYMRSEKIQVGGELIITEKTLFFIRGF